MEINRVSSVYPVIRVEGFKKNSNDSKKDKNDNEKSKKEFQNELNTKKREGTRDKNRD